MKSVTTVPKPKAVRKKRTNVRAPGDFNAHRTFRMRASSLKKLDAYSNRTKITRAELLRRFIEQLPSRGSGINMITVDVS